ncbi:hypothetical protein CRG98_009801 [Punica granatum]|nr:hypothetical protein CRG98_009801 [Punica granatum]
MDMQGVRGPEPRFPLGNISNISSLVSESTSSCMSGISHDIAGRLLPHYIHWSKLYGKRFIYWNGFEPRLCLTETELVKEMLSKYSSVSGKSWLQQEGSKNFIGRGLLMANGEDWYHQRCILGQAFTGVKLKAYAEYVEKCTEDMLQCMRNAMALGQTEFEIGGFMTELTADIISRVVFGSSYENGKQIIHMLTILQRLCAQASRHLCPPGSR